ncbi:putative WD domain-containing protein [Colletotrichum karsti]|uniref:WD domain-containing protein n=1 Tax=Colletotrichum karsti TaxID=1095194 RepID=A0A9P6I311_9PEZI|nr:putative WD domain-containing protein [Colletotrichum karsti]KAF9874837.1 putative WD domain-containing protein [Colletotrichum karsti]
MLLLPPTSCLCLAFRPPYVRPHAQARFPNFTHLQLPPSRPVEPRSTVPCRTSYHTHDYGDTVHPSQDIDRREQPRVLPAVTEPDLDPNYDPDPNSHHIIASNNQPTPPNAQISFDTDLSTSAAASRPSSSPPDDIDNPTIPPTSIAQHSSTAPGTIASPSAPRQVLGRRQRAFSDSDRGSPPATSAGASQRSSHRAKRRRGGSNMISDGDGVASNGTSRAYSNGARADPPLTASSTNGTRKAAAMNGSSRTDKEALQTMSSTYHGHNREEVTRILIQALSDMGYHGAAESVSRDSGYELESPTVAAFRNAVVNGDWGQAEELLYGAVMSDDQSQQGNGLVLAPGSDRNVMRFWLRQQKFLELLEQRDTSRALMVLRTELTPLYQDTQKLHFLSSLLMCQSTEDLKAKAEWDGAHGQSRKVLLSELSKCISPSVMLPENRLAVLLQQVKQSQIDSCLWHTTASSPSLYSDHDCERRYFPTEVALELTDLTGEVWQVQFSHDGKRLAACGSEDAVVIWDLPDFSVSQVLRSHNHGVGNFSWSPDDTMLVTCSQDKYARLWDTTTGELIVKLERFEEPASGCVWSADSKSFVTGSLDKLHGLRTWSTSGEMLCEWGKKHRVQDICGSPDDHWLVAVDDVQKIHVYNRTTRELEYEMELKARPTCVSISQDSRHLLVNKKDGEVQLIDLATRTSVQKFLGHTGGEFIIRSAFGGANESFVISGSEDGHILIWHKNSGAAVERLEGHQPRTNAVSWNPKDPCMLASCGDDGKVKVWSNKNNNSALRLRHNGASSRGSNGWREERTDE